MTTAILGAHGLIGSAIAQHLGALTLARRAPADRLADVAGRLDFSGIDALVHAAGVIDEDFSDPTTAFQHAIAGTAAVIEAARAADVKRFCYISSAHVYGPLRGRIDETSPPDPRSDYAIAHFAAEQIIRRAATDAFRVLILRPCAVFGLPPDGFRRWSLVPFEFPLQAVKTGTIALRSHGLQQRNFVGTGDIAHAVESWLARDAAAYECVNPIGRSASTVLDFAHLCAREYQALTGRPCAVTAPLGADSDNFIYGSTVPQSPRDELAATVRALIARLLERSAR